MTGGRMGIASAVRGGAVCECRQSEVIDVYMLKGRPAPEAIKRIKTVLIPFAECDFEDDDGVERECRRRVCC
jgi:hypothetical protein